MFKLALLPLGLLLAVSCRAPATQVGERESLSVLTWNIWHGGREDGELEGLAKVVEILRESGADLIAMQETYGSGEWISAQLGFHFHPRGTNVSIHSRYPIVEDVSVFEEFKCVGAVIELPGNRRVAFYSIWLPYDAEIWAEGTREGISDAACLAACASSAKDLEKILEAIRERLDGTVHAEVPILVAGDFNSMSHLDYVESARGQYGRVIDWPTSRVMTSRGFIDAYRDVHPQVDRARDRTWTPRFPEQQQDRIDFIYSSTSDWRSRDASVIDECTGGFPSDHAAVRVILQ